MSTLIWDDEDAPGIDSLTPEEASALAKKMGDDLVLQLQLEDAVASGQIH